MNYTFSEKFVKALLNFVNTSQYGHVAGLAQMLEAELKANQEKQAKKSTKPKK